MSNITTLSPARGEDAGAERLAVVGDGAGAVHDDLGVDGRDSIASVAGAVGRAVLDDHHLEREQPGAQPVDDLSQRLREQPGLVVRGDHDADVGAHAVARTPVSVRGACRRAPVIAEAWR